MMMAMVCLRKMGMGLGWCFKNWARMVWFGKGQKDMVGGFGRIGL